MRYTSMMMSLLHIFCFVQHHHNHTFSMIIFVFYYLLNCSRQSCRTVWIMRTVTLPHWRVLFQKYMMMTQCDGLAGTFAVISRHFIPYCRAFWHMHLKVNMGVYLNIGAPEVYCNIYNIGAPAIFDSFSKRVFFLFFFLVFFGGVGGGGWGGGRDCMHPKVRQQDIPLQAHLCLFFTIFHLWTCPLLAAYYTAVIVSINSVIAPTLLIQLF